MSLSLRIAAVIAFLSLSSMLGEAQSADAAIRAVIQQQVKAWNRGDLTLFAATYASDCVFVGTPHVRGRDQVLERYRTKYPNRDAMGQLRFTDLEVNIVDAHSAIVLGRFTLDRSPQGGGGAHGVFSLVMREQNGRWAIILDHTS